MGVQRHQKQHQATATCKDIWVSIPTSSECSLTCLGMRTMHFIVKCSVLIPRQVSEACWNCDLKFSEPLKHITTSCISTLNVQIVFWDDLVDTLSPNCRVFLSGLDNKNFYMYCWENASLSLQMKFETKTNTLHSWKYVQTMYAVLLMCIMAHNLVST